MTKHTCCIVTFQKENGNIIVRPRFSDEGLEIGDRTSMGWKVLDIHYQFNDGNYYRKEDYIRKLDELSKQRMPFKQKMANIIIYKLRRWSEA